MAVLIAGVVLFSAAVAPADTPVLAIDGSPLVPDDVKLPRNEAPWEREFFAQRLGGQQPAAPVAIAAAPTGRIHCVAEYEPMDGLVISWEPSGDSDWQNILQQIAVLSTGSSGNARIYVSVDTTSERTTVQGILNGLAVPSASVSYIVRTTDSIWMRDYGPRYIYEGGAESGVRAIVDHVYNRPRPNDNTFPVGFATAKNHARYDLALTHGGGNFHLDALNHGFATRLINNENPGLTESQIIQLWGDYQNLEMTLLPPFPTSVDATQHLDMWAIFVSDTKVMVSDWPNNVGSTQDVICDNAAADFAADGYTVYRLPARSIGGVHFTYANAVILNDLVILPTYSQSQMATHNSQALAVWQEALPDHNVVQLNGQALAEAAGVFHCIVMHVPANSTGELPTTYVRTQNVDSTLEPDDSIVTTWSSDDDVAVVNIDLELSLDGGTTWTESIVVQTNDDGTHTWTVPDVYTTDGRLRVVARDADGNVNGDMADGVLTILGTPPLTTPDGMMVK